MKTHIQKSRSGFTLMELMVAMAITTIIVTILVSITSIATDTWNRSRSELRAMRQGKVMIDTLTKDFEAMVARRGNDFEWLVAEAPNSPIGDSLQSSNASDLTFFTAVTDRYDGQIGSSNSNDNGGDVSCVAYRLKYRDPIDSSTNEFKTFVLNRLLVNPDVTFTDLLGKDDLKNAFTSFESEVDEEKNFVCENVYQFSVVFHIEVATTTGTTTTLQTERLGVSQNSGSGLTKAFRFLGTGIESDSQPPGVTAEQLKAARIKAVEISLTVLSDLAADAVRKGTVSPERKKKLLAEQSYQYSKLIQVPTI